MSASNPISVAAEDIETEQQAEAERFHCSAATRRTAPAAASIEEGQHSTEVAAAGDTLEALKVEKRCWKEAGTWELRISPTLSRETEREEKRREGEEGKKEERKEEREEEK